jgi:hypothetical protein
MASLVLRRTLLQVFNVGYASVLSLEGLSLDERRVHMVSDPVALVGGLVVGLAGIFVGGFIAARIAGHRELVYAAGAGILTMLVLLALLVCCGALTQARMYTILAYGLTIPSAILGGYVASKRTGKASGYSGAAGVGRLPPSRHG